MNLFVLTRKQIAAIKAADFISGSAAWGYRDKKGKIHR